MLRMGRISRMWWTFGLAVVCSVAGVREAFAAAKTDVVELVNGDRITCEIKKLDRGKLSVKTDGLGTHLDRVGRHPVHLEQSSVRRPACVWVPDVRHACPGRQANRRCRRGGANRTVRARGHREDCAARRHVLATARRFDLCRLQLYGSEQSNAMDVRLERELSQSPMAD